MLVTQMMVSFQKNIIQSLFKYKHEIGTTTHFTTEQKGTTVKIELMDLIYLM